MPTGKDQAAGPVRRATIIDVARRAGVSRQTVSRAMNDLPGISARTRERVLAAAAELRYRPSRFGRGLVEQGPITVGLVVRDLSNAFFSHLGTAVVRTCGMRGWNVVLAESDHTPDPERVPRDLARRVDAIVGYGLSGEMLPGTSGMPVVRLDDTVGSESDGGLVHLTTDAALADLCDHLREVGVRFPVMLDLVGDSSGERSRIFAEALAPLCGGAPLPVRPAQLSTGHEEVLREVVADGADAVIAFNDEMAVRLLRTLRELGVDVPGRMRLVGVDGLEIGELVTPRLTTLAVDVDEVAEAIVELVAGMLEGTVPLCGPEARREVAYRLEVRGTT